MLETDSVKNILGKTDSDFFWNKQADFYSSVDRKISQKNFIYSNKVESLPLKNRTAEILISKNPLLDKEGNCIGISGYFTEITGHCFVKKMGYHDDATKRFYFDGNSTRRYLTSKELEILKLLMIGHHPKKIGLILNISKRTVDSYMEKVKIKLNCHTNSEIVPTAFTMGFSFLILNQ